jgi:hypothetical protein
MQSEGVLKNGVPDGQEYYSKISSQNTLSVELNDYRYFKGINLGPSPSDLVIESF